MNVSQRAAEGSVPRNVNCQRSNGLVKPKPLIDLSAVSRAPSTRASCKKGERERESIRPGNLVVPVAPNLQHRDDRGRAVRHLMQKLKHEAAFEEGGDHRTEPVIPRVVRRGRGRRIDVIGAGREVVRDLVRQVGIAHRRPIGGRVIGQRPDERVELDQVE